MQNSIKLYEYTPSLIENQTITILFCMNQSQELHTKYLSHFLALIQHHKITCKPIYTKPVTVDDCIAFLRHTPCSFIICMDNDYLRLISQAHSRLFLAAPIICVDWGEPVSPPTPLPQKCFVVTTALPFFVEQMCSIVRYIPTIQKVCLLYCPQDLLLMSLLPNFEAWFKSRNYDVRTLQRMPTITGNDVIALAAFDMVIFLCRNAPSDYLTRLTTVCKEQHTILYISNPIGVHYGAPCAFGPHLEKLAAQTLQVMIEFLSTSTVSSPTVVDYQLSINTTEVAQLPLLSAGLNSFIALASKTTVITPTTADKVSAYLRLEQVPLE